MPSPLVIMPSPLVIMPTPLVIMPTPLVVILGGAGCHQCKHPQLRCSMLRPEAYTTGVQESIPYLPPAPAVKDRD